MRKPDGMSVEEVIRLGGRQSLSAPSLLHGRPLAFADTSETTAHVCRKLQEKSHQMRTVPRSIAGSCPCATRFHRFGCPAEERVAESAFRAVILRGFVESQRRRCCLRLEDDDLPAVDMLIPMIITERPAPATSSSSNRTTGAPVKPATKPAVSRRPAHSTQRPAPPPPASTQRNVLKDISAANARPGVAGGAARALPKTSVIKELGKSLEASQPRGRVVSI